MIDFFVATVKHKEIWDNIVFQSRYSTIFHTWDFLTAMEKYSIKRIGGIGKNATLCPLIAVEKNREIGVVPLFTYQFPLIRLTVSPPFAVEDYFLGPLLIDYNQHKMSTSSSKYLQFITRIDEYLKKELKSSIILIHSCPGIDDARPFIWNGYEVEPGYSNYIPLSKGIDVVWTNLSKSARRAINRGQELGIKIREGTDHDLEKLYQIMVQRGRIVPPFRYIQDLSSHLRKNGLLKVFIAEKNEDFLTGMVTLIHKQRMSFWIGCPKCSYEGISPNVLLMWSGIEQACQDGYAYFEIMGNDDLDLFPFKSKFGGHNIPYFNIKWYAPVFRVGHCLFRALHPKY
jgi:lipid II:glycine glycyltransferase (peptidoglycan interpeptide bridge formation enzyme)